MRHHQIYLVVERVQRRSWDAFIYEEPVLWRHTLEDANAARDALERERTEWKGLGSTARAVFERTMLCPRSTQLDHRDFRVRIVSNDPVAERESR